MNSRQFNGLYRPLVKAAWLRHCEATGTAPNNKAAQDLWYRQTLHDITKGQIHSTKGISPKMQQFLVDAFRAMGASAPEPERVTITGWSEAQVDRFHEVARAAWRKSCIDGNLSKFLPWLKGIMLRHRHCEVDGIWLMHDQTESFDKLMADVAITANDEYWIMRTAEQGEIRLRWQLRRFLVDLDYLTKTTHDWGYIVGMWRQADQMPESIDDAPAVLLWKVLQMLDTHIRRLCKDLDIEPNELPTRSHGDAANHPHIIAEDSTHLHIGHELEHVPESVHVDAQEPVPF